MKTAHLELQMNLKQLLASKRRVLSYELFPPKSEKGENALRRHLDKLVKFEPDFITCTYGAGGSSQEKTLEIVKMLKQDYETIVASHLTLVNSTVDDLRAYLERARDSQIDAIVALRGDPPEGESQFQSTTGGLSYANQLVELINQEFPSFDVAVAGYPETHREAPSPEVDLENLKRKVDAGADLIITQLFYDNADFYRFRDRCDATGIEVPILPGILPITNLAQAVRIANLCGSSLPSSLKDSLESKTQDEQFDVGVAHATSQVDDLVNQGVDGIHFYVLNQSKAVTAILSALQNEFKPIVS